HTREQYGHDPDRALSQFSGARECACVHSIDVEGSVEMVYLVLKNARVPTMRIDRYFFATLIQTLNANVQRTLDNCLVAFHAETTFEKPCRPFIQQRELRIDDHVKGNCRALKLCQL